MYEIEELNDLAAVASRRREWQALVENTKDATFFHTFDWLELLWRHYGAGRKLRALFVSRGSELVGILPLVVQTEQRKVGPVRILTYPLLDWGSFYGPLGAEPEATLAAGLKHIYRTRRDWDLVELRWLRKGDSLVEMSEGALRQGGSPPCQRVRAQTSLIHLPQSWDAYFTSLNKKFRETFRRYQRKLNEQGEVTYTAHRPRGEAHADSDPRWDMYETCEQIAEKSWQGSSENGTTLSHASIRPFLREVHAMAARTGTLDMHLMHLNGQPLAFAYNYHYRGSVFGLRIGYDAELSKNGVGNHMTLHAVRHAIERGDQLYDMGPGSLDYKRVFTSEVVDILQYTHYYPLAVRTQALRFHHWVEQIWNKPEAATADDT